MKYKATITIECSDKRDMERAVWATSKTLEVMVQLKETGVVSKGWEFFNTLDLTSEKPSARKIAATLHGPVKSTFFYEEIEEAKDERDRTNSEAESR